MVSITHEDNGQEHMPHKFRKLQEFMEFQEIYQKKLEDTMKFH